MRDIAVPDDAGGRGTRLCPLRVDVLDLRHKAIRISVNAFTGDITATFSIAQSSSGTVTPCGKKQMIFYNDGTKFVEA